ncbi:MULTISPECIES: beta-ketoacyl synthase [unclassified Streptomyces]|uniref:beta-ketoacyl-[acyl-carrier-protein] synthase family protein n=1 Tax=unclassified Streptomyces TaxID=2593676 RepID=UPI000892683A|nr:MULTISPECIES: beta-ketoacyl-ACP synthase II [unclassified Streptomyces]PBC83505.1 3-oxoacyl-[acyl-carrier-protein] synthase II [Streptomyces sp. 2321.6]SDR41700.1 3-oxoacyl-[acyl-carrier-protein] synthase II [Streptomyces sp. KS_16]SEC98850.1 3-oxoacyl-[acyl-carrier-protein] synthase II [Streptomyces sp. 2133.1]SEE76324.1 3-oxoacyl-[acyl-carrier-protein] synthase II [Streptomyces sp. 2112.3]SNC69583.1 3-oxoacyl-[acyl-carrier-protein] synthase II [Streptomyces sp. 2114.4]
MELRTDRRRVVVTGCGVVSPVGNTTADFWAALLAGRSGVRPLTRFDVSRLPVRIGGDVTGFDTTGYLTPQEARRCDRFTQYAAVAAGQAMRAAGLEESAGRDPYRFAAVIGSGYGAAHAIQQQYDVLTVQGPRRVSPYHSVLTAIDHPASLLSIKYGIKGPSCAVSAACATGAVALGEAAELVRSGRADIALAGGTDDALTAVDLAGTANAQALSRRNDDPEGASRPFDRDRDGFVMAVGATVLTLEEAGHAERRGAEILAEVAGYAATTDAHHATAPDPTGAGAVRAIRGALADAGLEPEDVGQVSAHGTGTLLNDRIEASALRQVLGPDQLSRTPVTAVKSMTGHMLGASGAAEAAAAVLSLRDRKIPPIRNCDHPEEEDLDLVLKGARDWDGDVVLSNSFGFGGHNAVLVLTRYTR